MSGTLAQFSNGLLLVVILSLPSIIAAVVAGIVISLIQTVLSIQDQTLPFAVKLFAVGVTLALSGRWLGLELLAFGEQALSQVAMLRSHGQQFP